MISELREIRGMYYANINTISYYVLLIFQFIYIRQKKKFPDFCVESVQNFLGTRSHNLVGTLVEDNRWYKKLFGKLISFFSTDFWIALEIYLMAAYIQYNGVFNRPFGYKVGTGANYFALLFINGSIYILTCIVIGLNPLKQMDWATPAYPLALIIAKIACHCEGCCWGIAWEHGVYNYRTERYEVPIQLIEAFWALLIFIFMMLYKKKAKRGTLFPLYLILFSGTRFFSEFLRREENVLGPLKVYHILCIVGVAVGIVLLLIVNKFGDKIDAHFDKHYRGVIGVAVQKIRGVREDGTYTEAGAKRAEKINEIVEKIKTKVKAYKKKREIRKRKGRIKF